METVNSLGMTLLDCPGLTCMYAYIRGLAVPCNIVDFQLSVKTETCVITWDEKRKYL